jgi:hypothetical protein
VTDERTDEIARAAARLIATGAADDVADAIRLAQDALGLADARPPTHGLVRRHVQGMSMQEMGAEAYSESVREVWRTAEQIMTAIEEGLEAETLLAGRAARGHVDAGVTLHVRVYTDRPMRDVVDLLDDLGYGEPSFETAETRFGRFDRIRLEESGCEVVITRCPPAPAPAGRDRDRDLFTGRPVETATVRDLRERT